MTTVIIATAILGSAFGQRAQVHEPPLPLADPVFLSQVAAVSKDFKYAAGFLVASQPSLKVAQAKVPKKVLDYTVVWLRKVMRSDVAEKLCKAQWTGYPNDLYHDEPLVAGTTFEDGRLTWSDDGGTAVVLIEFDGKVSLDDKNERDAFVEGTLSRLFNLSDQPKDKTHNLIERVAGSPTPLFAGCLYRGQSKLGQITRDIPVWDSWFLVATDGRRMFVQVNFYDQDNSNCSKPWQPGDTKKSRFAADSTGVSGSPPHSG